MNKYSNAVTNKGPTRNGGNCYRRTPYASTWIPNQFLNSESSSYGLPTSNFHDPTSTLEQPIFAPQVPYNGQNIFQHANQYIYYENPIPNQNIPNIPLENGPRSFQVPNEQEEVQFRNVIYQPNQNQNEGLLIEAIQIQNDTPSIQHQNRNQTIPEFQMQYQNGQEIPTENCDNNFQNQVNEIQFDIIFCKAVMLCLVAECFSILENLIYQRYAQVCEINFGGSHTWCRDVRHKIIPDCSHH